MEVDKINEQSLRLSIPHNLKLENSLSSPKIKKNKKKLSFDNPKRKRRSKRDPNGRIHLCECGRAYLSPLALNNHKKSKHFQNLIIQKKEENISKKVQEIEKLEYLNPLNNCQNFSSKRGRGRPKKHTDFDNYNNPEILFKTFYQKEFRCKKKGEENFEIKKILEKFSKKFLLIIKKNVL